jgi:hypothetical protein
MITKEQLATWKRIEKAATPGPWYGMDCPVDRVWEEELPQDAAFITAARAAVPELLTAVEELFDRAERAEAEVARLQTVVIDLQARVYLVKGAW